ncbi:MAG: hypothetical protein JKY73_01140 [Lutibacter sp.]|nr:hypothetical protein [Lutibacter sp.]
MNLPKSEGLEFKNPALSFFFLPKKLNTSLGSHIGYFKTSISFGTSLTK